MPSKATHRTTTVDVIKQQKKAAKRLAGQQRQEASGVSAASSSTTSLAPSSQASSAGDNNASFLKTAGDTMVGPIAFWMHEELLYPTSSNNNTLDLTEGTGAYTSHWIWAAAGSGTLEILSGAAFSGQILFIEGVAGVNQTIKDRSNTSGGNTGNIKTLDENDLVLGTTETIALFMYSSVDGLWHQVSNPSAGSSGADTSLSNLTSTGEAHFANPTLSNLGTTNINTDLLPNQSSGGNLGSSSASKYWYNLYGGRIQFTGKMSQVTTYPSIQVVNNSGNDDMIFSLPDGSNDKYVWDFNGNEMFRMAPDGLRLGDSSSNSSVDGTIYRAGSDVKVRTNSKTVSFSDVVLSTDDVTWTGDHIFDTSTSGSTSDAPVKFQGDGGNSAQRVLEIGEFGVHSAKFIAEIEGDTGRQMSNPAGGSDIAVPGSDPALSIKSAMIMNTYTMYDLDTLVFSQSGSSTTPAPEDDWVFIEANTGTGSTPNLTGMTYNVPTSKTHQFKVNNSLKISIDDNIEFETGSTLNFKEYGNPSSWASGGGTALPSNPTAYFKVKYNGADRYIPYYTAS